MRYLIALALLLSGCGPFCGDTAIGALITFSETKEMCSDYDARFVSAREFLMGSGNQFLGEVDWEQWSLFVRKEASWDSGTGATWAGETHCVQYRSIFIGDASPGESALAHEMVHAMQGCKSGPDDEDGHKYWNEQGIWELLRNYSSSLTPQPR